MARETPRPRTDRRAPAARQSTTDAADAVDDVSAVTRRSVLAGTGAALLAAGAGAGAASAAPSGQVGTGGRPVERLFTDAIAGGLTGGTPLTTLTDDPLADLPRDEW